MIPFAWLVGQAVLVRIGPERYSATIWAVRTARLQVQVRFIGPRKLPVKRWVGLKYVKQPPVDGTDSPTSAPPQPA